MTTCHIAFDHNPMKIVYSGQSVHGTVQLNLAEEINVRGIYIHLYGGAYTNWRAHLKCYKIHAGSEDYLTQRIYLLGATNGIDYIKWNEFRCILLSHHLLNQ